MGTEDEAKLVERAKSDTDAFRQLYEKYLPRIYRYAYYRTEGREQAEDVVSQTFLRAWEYLPRYEQRGIPFQHWLYRIAANIIRSRRTKPIPVGLTWDLGVVEPVAATEKVDQRLDLLRYLRTLPEAQQQALVLRYVQDLSVEEVAQIMGKSAGAVKQLTWRGLTNLRERMGDHAVKYG